MFYYHYITNLPTVKSIFSLAPIQFAGATTCERRLAVLVSRQT